jgi:hypothetical protein
MTCRRSTPEEIQQAHAEFGQWRLPVLTLGLDHQTRTRDGGKAMNGHSTKPGPLTQAGQ